MKTHSKEQIEKAQAINAEGRNHALKYFDRIQDNMFNYNNLLIGGFFALGQLKNETPQWTIFFPLLNMAILTYINYKLMNIFLYFAGHDIKDSIEEIFEYKTKFLRTVYFSVAPIVSTLIVTIIFIYLICRY